MKDSTKLLLTSIMVFLLLCILVGGIYAFISWSEVPISNSPQISQEYKNINLELYKNYDGVLYYNDEINRIIETSNGSDYYIGTKNIIYDEKKEIGITSILYNNNYRIYYDKNYNKYYYIKISDNKKSKYYDSIYPINCNENENSCNNFILVNTIKNNNTFSILSLYDDSITNISNKYFINYNEYYYVSPSFLVVYNDSNKYGIIDYSGNIKIDCIYDQIYPYENALVVFKNNKYGIINENNKTFVNTEYDNIVILDNYIVLIKDKKINIMDNKYNNICEIDSSFYEVNEENNEVYLITYKDTHYYSYIINNKGIDKKIDTQIYNLDGIYYSYEKTNEEKIIITFYDNNYNYNYNYNYEINTLKDNTYYVEVFNTINNIAMISLYNETLNKYEYFYIDMKNKIESNMYDAKNVYFDNGYTFTINNDNVLTIYENKAKVIEFNNVIQYIGNYMFITKNNDIYSIYRVTFKND